MALKKKGGGHGGHGWFVTFADLMALLVAFFVMLAASSTQDIQKLQAVAGSMREAFGTQTKFRYAGLVEIDGLPTRTKLQNAAHVSPEESSSTPGPSERRRQSAEERQQKHDRGLAMAAATLRQAFQDMPDIAEISKHVMIEEARDGLNVEIVDQDGRSMFPEGSSEPYERTKRLIKKLAVPLKSAKARITITGHTSAPTKPRPGLGAWELSSNRAHAVRQILEEEGVGNDSFFAVTGKADIQPLFPDDPAISSNRRVTITLMREEPPMPTGFSP
jgi:chemotaxis protein MotB